MSTRRQFRELIARGKLVLMPGAYDALSARIMEAEGFEAIIAGGYAAIGSMMGQADMGQCNVRDYADHYARICAAVNIPVYVDGDTGFGGVNNVREMVHTFESAGVAGLFFSDQVFPTVAATCRASRSCRLSRCSPASRPHSTPGATATC
jgi:2,3-dimethylmalate lyase